MYYNNATYICNVIIKRITMTYEVAKQIANGNQEVLYKTFAQLVKMAQDSGMSLIESKREAKAMLNCMVNAWNKTQNNEETRTTRIA